MAQVFQIKDDSGTTTYNLLSDDLYILPETWQTEIGGDGLVTETMVIGGAATDANVRTATQKLDEFINQVNLWFGDQFEDESVWAHIYSDGETAKRALVYEMEINPVTESRLSALLGVGGAKYELVVVRDEQFEDASSTTFVNNQTLTNYGAGTYTIAAIAGAKDARISKTTVSTSSGAGATLFEFWFGIRPTRYGFSSFEPFWEAESYYSKSSSASVVTDANASGGASNNCLEYSFGGSGTTAFQVVYYITIDDVIGDTNYDHFVGRYEVLACVRSDTASSVFGLKMQTGFVDSPGLQPYEPIWTIDEPDTTYFRLYSLGEVNIPHFAMRSAISANVIRYWGIQIMAQRVTNNASKLRIDGLCFIPSEHKLKLEKQIINSTGNYTEFHTFENGETATINVDSAGKVVNNALAWPTNWRIPIQGGVLIGAINRVSYCINSETVAITMAGYRKHKTHSEV